MTVTAHEHGNKNHGEKSLPPGPGALATLAALPSLLRNPMLLGRELIARYGGIVRLNIGLDNLYLIGQADYADYVLREHSDQFRKSGKLWNAASAMLGNGIATSEGDFWLRQRRIMQPQFTRQRLSALSDIMTSAAREELESWRELATGQPFNLAAQVTYLSIGIFLRTIFNTGMTRAEREEVGRATNTVISHLHHVMWGAVLPKWAVLPGTRRWNEAMRVVDQFVASTIDKRRRAEVGTAERGDDILGLLIGARDESTGEAMSDQQLRDEATTLILAGFETTATAITWSLYELCRHPELERKIRQECDSVLGTRPPTFADLARLTYTKMFLSETLRVHSVVWMVHRLSTAEAELGGFRIPANSIVVVLVDAIHHNPALWKSPHEFQPERFSQQESAGRPRAAFLPFGMGPHQCIGNNLALIQATQVLVMLLQRYRIKLATPLSVQSLPRIVQKPREEVLVRLVPIENARREAERTDCSQLG